MLIATAGHVDHGKSTLVKALTGTDTDRLPEEKKRGLTIEPGFAYRLTPQGKQIGFVDVPGHEKFIRNMASVVAAVDIALLVIAADDGIMPQTREHVSILSLFGVQKTIVAITRCDLVDQATLDTCTAEALEFLKSCGMEVSATRAVCAIDGTGIDDLLSDIENLADMHHQAEADGLFRMAVDRSFTLHGSGTVVTGTVFHGSLSESATINILPANIQSRVRSIRVNNSPIGPGEFVLPGQRVALNLNNVKPANVKRGAWITSTEHNALTKCLDVHVTLLQDSDAPLKHWTPLHIHIGSAALTGRIALYDERRLEPGTGTYAQLVLNSESHAVFGDRFILRDQSAMHTLGGGSVIDPFANRSRVFRKNRRSMLEALHQNNCEKALLSALRVSKNGLSATEFRLSRNLSEEKFKTMLIEQQNVSLIHESNKPRLLDRQITSDTEEQINVSINQFHHNNPTATGPLQEDVFREMAREQMIGREYFDLAVSNLVNKKIVERYARVLKLVSHLPKLETGDQQWLDGLLEYIKPDTLKPPAVSEIAKNMDEDRDDLLDVLHRFSTLGYFIKVTENRYFHPLAVEKLGNIATELSHAHQPTGFNAKMYRDQTGIGRNITIDVLEYFDRTGLTQRRADCRTTAHRSR